MSQEKVERNKKLKENRKSINRKKRIKDLVGNISLAIILVAMIVWVGFSIYTKTNATDADTQAKVPVDISAVTDYLTEITPTEED